MTLMCVSCNKAPSLLKCVTQCVFLQVLWFDTTQTHKQTQHTRESVHWHTHINIYLHHLLCAHGSCLFYIDIKNLLSTMPFLFKNYSLVEVIYLLTRCYKTRFFLWNTNNTDRNGVNKQKKKTHTHTHTKHSEKYNTGKDVCMKI